MGIRDMTMHQEPDYEAEHALDVIIEADKVQQDDKLMERVQEVASQKAEAASRIAQEYGNEAVPSSRHPDRDRDSKVNF